MNYIPDLTSFSINVPFLSQDPVQDTMLSSPPDCDSFSSLFFMTLTPLKSTGQIFVKCPLILVCLMFSKD